MPDDAAYRIAVVLQPRPGPSGRSGRGPQARGHPPQACLALAPLEGGVTLRITDDILALLERAVADALALELSPARCRVVIAAAGSALKALEVGSIEERLAAVEQAAGVQRSA